MVIHSFISIEFILNVYIYIYVFIAHIFSGHFDKNRYYFEYLFHRYFLPGNKISLPNPMILLYIFFLSELGKYINNIVIDRSILSLLLLSSDIIRLRSRKIWR